jgi:acetyl/propionyl-CoA carboxylase alpha subunit
VRNDTGVFEGGEISIYYDPMIAKLCTWGKDRASAIEHMRVALDEFEVEGIGHNLPFLAAVMDHPRSSRARSPPPSSPRNTRTASAAQRHVEIGHAHRQAEIDKAGHPVAGDAAGHDPARNGSDRAPR